MSFISQDITSLMAAVNASSTQFPNGTLQAWAFFKPDGTLVRGSNIASVMRNSAGNYTLSFNAAVTGDYTVDVWSEQYGKTLPYSGTYTGVSAGSKSSPSFGFNSWIGGAAGDCAANTMLYAAVYK